MHRLIPLALALSIAVAASAQMPDSPTGRMAAALGELAASDDPSALDAFLAERVSADAPEDLAIELAAMRKECAGGQITMARKAGAHSASITLEIPGGRCELEYSVAPDPPHGLVRLGVGVMMGHAPARALDLDLPTGDDAALAAALDEKLREMAAEGRFSGVVLAARGGEPLFHRAYGAADRSTGRPNTVDTRFDIGSITKGVTRIAIAQLAAAGKLDLDATLQSLLPDYPNPEIGQKITIQQLLDHSSGLGDIFNERWQGADKAKYRNPHDFFPLFADQPLAFEPGTSEAYSNAGFVVLGAVIAAVSGQSYFDYVEEKIFAPAGMRDSAFAVRDGTDPKLAIGYTRQSPDGPTDELESNLGRLPIQGCPAGSSSHTAADLLALDRALRGGKLLDPAWTAWFFTGEHSAGGDEAGRWSIGIAGGGPGVSALLEGNGDTTVVVLSNLDPPTATQIGSSLFRAIASR